MDAYTSAGRVVPVADRADWPCGVYFARLDATTGAPGSRRSSSGRRRRQQPVAVVMPTTTWQAYNFCDGDGDGWGDTWYARGGRTRSTWRGLTPAAACPTGTAATSSRSCTGSRAGKQVDTYADEDLEPFASPAALRAAYGLIVFPGHTEYVTGRYDLIQGYRDLGGNLMFLSANNFFRRVDLPASS